MTQVIAALWKCHFAERPFLVACTMLTAAKCFVSQTPQSPAGDKPYDLEGESVASASSFFAG
jgi:hypothetical protein